MTSRSLFQLRFLIASFAIYIWAAPDFSFANQKESYKDLISKSQNLSLQHDRLQACQILIRALQKESKNSNAYRELSGALESLGTVFYTDQAQAVFSQGESLVDLKTKDAIDKYQEANKLEEGNVAILRALARAQLKSDDCSNADTSIKSLESYDPISAEYFLLQAQALQCHKNFESLDELLKTGDFGGVEKYIKVFAVDENYVKKDFKKAKQLVAAWEAAAPDYPEVYFWKWQISTAQNTPDKTSAEKYLQICRSLTPRKRKTFNLDVDLCKSTEDIEAKLKTLKP